MTKKSLYLLIAVFSGILILAGCNSGGGTDPPAGGAISGTITFSGGGVITITAMSGNSETPYAVITINGPLSEGKVTPSGMGRVGVLIQPDLAADFRTAETTSENGQPSVFPWDRPVDYLDRLGQYTALSLLTLDRTNGFCLDSPQASQDTQRG